MMNTKKQEMREEAKAAIIEKLEDGYNGYLCDLHNEVFNTDYYVIGREVAKAILNEYGCFEAIGEVQEYEQDNFGEVSTDLSDTEKVVNMLYYIIGEDVFNDLLNACGDANDLYNAQIEAEDGLKLAEMFREVKV